MVSFTGLGSGLALDTLLTQLVAAERAPTASRLDRRDAETQVKLSATASLRAELSKFQGTLSTLRTLTGLAQRTATSTEPNVVTATATSDAVPSSYDITVGSLAAAHRIAAAGQPATTTNIGTGILTFRFGTYTVNETVFTADPDRTSKSVTITSSTQSLEGIRQAVNNANIGVRASIVDDGSGKRLVFQSETSGAAGGLEVVVDDDDLNDTDNSGLSVLAFSATTKNAATIEAGANAQVTIDGLTVTRSTNDITGAIEGVTLNLVDLGSAQLTIATNTRAADSAVRGMVTGYNDLMKLVNQLTLFDADTGVRGVMLGDAAVRGIARSVRGALTDSIVGMSGASIQSLVDVGLTTNSNGTLAVNSTKLSNALANNFDDVARLFALSGSTTDPLIRYVSATSDTVPGTYNVSVSTLAPETPATSGYYLGVPNTTLTVDANNDALSVSVDGTASGTIFLTQQGYASGDALAAELQTKINADATLLAAGAAVTVTYASGRFTITSNSTGSASTVDIDSVDTQTLATLGITTGIGAPGADDSAELVVTGTINAGTTTAVGSSLTGTGDAAGLTVDVLGGTTGARGSVTVMRGIAARLGDLLTDLLATDGPLDAKTTTLNKQTQSITRQREALDKRMAAVEAHYKAQFQALDALVANLQSTASFLTREMDNLPFSRRSDD